LQNSFSKSLTCVFVKAVLSFRDLLALDDFTLTVVAFSDLVAFLLLAVFVIVFTAVPSDDDDDDVDVIDVDVVLDGDDVDKLENEDELIELSNPLEVDEAEEELFSKDDDVEMPFVLP
jgi:hypothetical protein